MKRRVVLMTAAVVAVGAGAAIPGAGAAEQADKASKAPGKAKVSVVDFSFNPSTVKIQKGGKVVWKFKQGRHNVKGSGFNSGIKESGRFKKKFKKTGTFNYQCTLHQPAMDGTVKVVK